MPKPIVATKEEARREAILHAVARALGAASDATPARVLIGGTALRIAHGLRRPSTDLDLAHLTDEGGEQETEVPEILTSMGFKVVSTTRDTKVPIRTNIVIRKAGWQNALSERITIIVDNIRTLEINPRDIVKRRGIWTTNVRKLLELKLDAIEDLSGEPGKRIKARDLFDVGFLLEKQGGIFTPSKIRHLSAIMDMSVYGAHQHGWAQAFTQDGIMKRSSLIEVGDEILQRIETYKAEVEKTTGTRWNALNMNRIGETSMAEIRTRSGDADWADVNRLDASMATTEWARKLAEATHEIPVAQLAMREHGTQIELEVHDDTGAKRAIGTSGSAREIAIESAKIGRITSQEIGSYTREIETGLARMRAKTMPDP